MSAKIVELLGSTLLRKKDDGSFEELATETALDSKVVALYSSASWCGPCRNFTPLLKKFHEARKEHGDFEIVFVSSDSDEDAFKEYYQQHHGNWLALPYTSKDIKAKVSRKFKVEGIPNLALLDPNGNTIHNDAASFVRGEEPGFPWTPKTLHEIVKDVTFKRKDGSEFTLSSFDGLKKQILFYVSAHWCPPCRGFTPTLVKAYETLTPAQKENCEFIFLSSDRDQESFDEYYGEMPWSCLPFSERKVKAELTRYLQVEGIPQFTVIDWDTSTIINPNARGEVVQDPDCKNFPWPEPASLDVNSDPSKLNGETCVIVLTDSNTAKDAITKYAEEYKKTCSSDDGYVFYHGDVNGPVAGQIISRSGLKPASANGPVVAVFKLFESGSLYAPDTQPSNVSEQTIKDLIADLENDKLTKGSL